MQGLKNALEKRDAALADMNWKAMQLARMKASFADARGMNALLLQAAGNAKAQELEAAIEALEDAQISVAFWRAVENGRQSLG